MTILILIGLIPIICIGLIVLNTKIKIQNYWDAARELKELPYRKPGE
jgi:hypothetical protein